jgi:hypothetical protein
MASLHGRVEGLQCYKVCLTRRRESHFPRRTKDCPLAFAAARFATESGDARFLTRRLQLGRGGELASLNFQAGVLIASASAATTAASAAVTTAISATVAPTASGALGLGPSFVHVQGAPANLRAVERGNGFFSVFVAGHFHEPKPARASCIAVSHDAYPIDLPVWLKQLPQLVFGGAEAQISDKNILHASASALSCRSASSVRRTGRSGGPS